MRCRAAPVCGHLLRIRLWDPRWRCGGGYCPVFGGVQAGRGRAGVVHRPAGRTVGSVAKELGVNGESLRQWVHKAQPAAGGDGDAMTPSEREELKRLRKQVRELELEKGTLHKAAQYFAKEMGR
ncbi:transposase [Streptomyces sp. NBC_00503]|nr:transposase [Streptomyces sp. NBC_00503]